MLLLFSLKGEARPLPSLNPAPPPDSRASYLKLMKTPTILILREFRKVCDTSGTSIDFEDQEVFDKLKELQKRLDFVVELRGLVFAAQKCTNGKSNLSLLEFLGVDVLLKQPKLLVRALNLEKANSDVLILIAKAEPDEIAGVDCSTVECQAKRKDAYKKKISALETAKIRKEEESVRQSLIAAIRSQTN